MGKTGRFAVRLVLVTVLIAMSIAAAACSNKSSGMGGDLEGIDWVLVSFAGEKPAVPDSMYVWLKFGGSDGGRLAGKAINSFSAAYEASTNEGTIKVGPIAGTQMAGPAEEMAVETALYAALDKAATYSSDGAVLKLFDESGARLALFEKGEATIEGAWNVTGYNNGKQAVQSVLANAPMTADFGPDGKISGRSGVNTYNGPYTSDGKSIKIGPLATTKMMGPEDAMAQEQAFLAALQAATTYELQGDKLTLRDAGGAIQATMSR